jgi:hypothetical protein
MGEFGRRRIEEALASCQNVGNLLAACQRGLIK